MADLEDFLRQAAERRRMKQAGQGSSKQRGPANPPKPRPPVIEPPKNDWSEPILLEAEVIEPIASGIYADSLPSNIPSPQHLAKGIEQADEKMLGHVKDVFEHRVGKLGSKPKRPKPAKPKRESMSNEETAVIRSPENTVGKDLMQLLSNPKSIRAAFIASEIFGRRF